jgi:hypothetical protein
LDGGIPPSLPAQLCRLRGCGLLLLRRPVKAANRNHGSIGEVFTGC